MKNILKNATFLDVRTPQEFAEGAYPDAINIPLNEVSLRLNEIKKMKQPIIAYCRSGNRSGMAVSLLKQIGLTEVYNGGGLSDLSQ